MSFDKAWEGYCNGPFGNMMNELDARMLDKELETSQDDICYVKCEKAGFEYFVEGERADVSVITDGSVDEEGESIDIKSINFDSFRKNPLVAFSHNYDQPPIGKSLWQKQVGDKIKAKTQFASRPSDFPVDKVWFPDSIFHLVKTGFLPGKSIGGIAKRRMPTKEEIETRPELSKAKTIRYNLKVYEYSVVTRQANNNAIVEAVSKGLIKISSEQLSMFFPEIQVLVKDIKNDVIKVGNFLTLEQYEQKLQKDIMSGLHGINSKTPEMIDDALARIFGKP